MSEQNVKTVQSIYAAFGRGDVPGILGQVAEGTEWGFNGARSEVPWHAPVKGKAALPQFFTSMAQNMDFHAFEPREFIHSGDHVIAHIHVEYTVKKTGKKVNMEQLHWWTLDRQGKVARLQHFEDTAQVLAACRG